MNLAGDTGVHSPEMVSNVSMSMNAKPVFISVTRTLTLAILSEIIFAHAKKDTVQRRNLL